MDSAPETKEDTAPESGLSLGYFTYEDAIRSIAGTYDAMRRQLADYPPSASEIANAGKRGSLKVTVFEGRPDDLDGNLSAAISLLQEQLDSVPAALRDTAMIDVTCDDYSSSLTIQYERPETDKEWKARKKDVERRAALAQTRAAEAERAEFDRLKAKFEKSA